MKHFCYHCYLSAVCLLAVSNNTCSKVYYLATVDSSLACCLVWAGSLTVAPSLAVVSYYFYFLLTGENRGSAEPLL
jgi:hypothetical protein